MSTSNDKVTKSVKGFQPGNKCAGSRKGRPNKATADIKAAILEAFEKAGGATYLAQVAKEQPQVFCALLGKVLPMTIGGGDGSSGKLTIKWET
jgi:hypothetical protein